MSDPASSAWCGHLVDATQRGDVDSLTTDDTGGADTAGVLTGAGVDDGINEDLEGVLSGEEMDDGAGVADDAHSLDLLAGVAACGRWVGGRAKNSESGDLS